MEKRNDYNETTPCRAAQADKPCDCSKCKSLNKTAEDKSVSIYDVDHLGEKHK